MAFTLGVALALAFGASPVSAGLEEVDHVVLFMQENRAFNHVGILSHFLRRFSFLSDSSLCIVFRNHGRREGIQ